MCLRELTIHHCFCIVGRCTRRTLPRSGVVVFLMFPVVKDLQWNVILEYEMGKEQATANLQSVSVAQRNYFSFLHRLGGADG